MQPRSENGPAWYVVSLRPRGDHDAMRVAARARGAGLIELSPWAIETCDDYAARAALDAALDCDAVIATSIPAVRAAVGLRPLHDAAVRWIAVGRGTARALTDAGVAHVDVPAVRMDSEGVLALPVLHAPGVRRIGVLTAPGGRDVLLPALRARGLAAVRADVYRRVDIDLDVQAMRAIAGLEAPAALAVSSSGALDRVMARLDADARARVLDMQVLAASGRIAALARRHGLHDIAVAASARPEDLIARARIPR